MISDFSSHGSYILQQHTEKSYEILHSSYGANRHLTYFFVETQDNRIPDRSLCAGSREQEIKKK